MRIKDLIKLLSDEDMYGEICIELGEKCVWLKEEHFKGSQPFSGEKDIKFDISKELTP